MYNTLDNRINQSIEIVESLISKKMYPYTDMVITEDNKVIIIVNKTLLYVVPLKGITYNLDNKGFLYSNLYDEEDNIKEYDKILKYNDLSIINNALYFYNMYTNIANNPNNIVASDYSLRDNESFEELLAIRPEQGMRYFKILGYNPSNEYMIPMFSGFINLNKPDKIGVNVLDINDGYLYIEFNIYKKKINRNLQLYCRLINI